jgi:hypothetical protein
MEDGGKRRSIYCGVTMISLQSGHLPLIPLSMNCGIVEPHPERESFVVERFSTDLWAWRNGTTTALKRSTTNLTCGRFMVPMRAKKEWRLYESGSIAPDRQRHQALGTIPRLRTSH